VNKLIHGCLDCGGCSRNMNQRCVINNDEVNEWIAKMKEALNAYSNQLEFFSLV
jgi:multimeric flavodoxin WrbA